MNSYILRDKSYDFAIQIVKLCQNLQVDKKEYILSKQLLKCGTAIGALIREAEFAQSKADFVNKMSIALKEANETKYWHSILKDTNNLDIKTFENLYYICNELIAMLVSSIKTAKK
jgi:four helix bundle protein